ncbi:MAG: PAS domain S-box protein [Candidatus Competibacter sp.]|nr:PAS domain S-box protein [Candidatus Competibacter sp.]
MTPETGGRPPSLRERAEAALLSRARRDQQEFSPAEFGRIIHDLSVYQLELELQNEELRGAQNQLELARDRYARLYDQAPVGYLTLDARGVIRQSNQTFAQMVGQENAELAGQSLAAFIDGSDQAVFRGRFKAFFNSPDGKSLDLSLRGRDGCGLAVRVTARKEAPAFPWRQAGSEEPLLLVIVSDITERKRAEEELRRLSLVAAHTTTAVFITDAAGRIEWVNPAFVRSSGFRLDEVEGRDLSLLWWGPETDSAAVAVIRAALAAGQGYQGEILSYHRDGSSYWAQLLIDPVGDGGDRVTRFIGVQTDITARRLARLELQEKNAELERFIYLVSHDLKSPLVTIKAFLGYLEQDLQRADAARIAQDMAYMRSAADRMGQLLEELLDLSRVGRVARPPVRVGFQELVEEALRLTAGGIAERGVTVRLLEAPLVLVGDRARLLEIWQNLIENAVKYMGEQTAPDLEIGAERRSWEWVFYVRDNGMGIEPRYHEKVFGLFEKLDPKSEGTGLGLALVKRIVELYRGQIWLESAGAGRGTCVRFTLPEAIEPRAEEARA